ncbi:MAG: hypothetical protein IT324_26975 [Anaerolineae bacterium]|nr:hypothetical protein [Anaerolineae bacterium]
MYVVMYVSKDLEQAEQVIELWVKAGITGITILESAGMQQVAQRGIRDDVGLVFSLTALLQSREVHHRTIFSVVRDEATISRVVNATTNYVGDWSRPDVGVLFVWPLAQAYGLDKKVR